MASKEQKVEDQSSDRNQLENTGETSNAEQPAPDAPVADVPDPDEADLDDLDDMLDDFSTKPVPKELPKPSGPGRPQIDADDPLNLDGLSDDDFAKQLQAGMADFMKEFEQSPEMQAQFESMLKGLGGEEALGDMAGAGSSKAPKESEPIKPPPMTADKAPPSTSKAAPAAGEESFQETIKKTMERMQASGESATAAASTESSDDLLAELMKAMQTGGGGGGEGSEEDFSKMILGMMEQLTNKEILYEPMKELDTKFPAWMEKNQIATKVEDLKRYKEQQVYVREIVARFEQPAYKDDNAADREYIVDKMQKMQAAGSPPADLVGDMAAAQEAFGAPEEGCPTQ